MARSDSDRTPTLNEDERVTLLDLVAAVAEFAESDAEALATLRHSLETSHVYFDAASIEEFPWAAQ